MSEDWMDYGSWLAHLADGLGGFKADYGPGPTVG